MEDTEFPILCSTCLGPNPYVRMTRQTYGKECKICTRPFTVFRWHPGPGARYKKTEICPTCARIKHVCQTCLLDLEYGLPIQVRDTILGQSDPVPRGQVNREYFVNQIESGLSEGVTAQETGGIRGNVLGAEGQQGGPSAGLRGAGGGSGLGPSMPNNPKARELLQKIARYEPYYERNRAKICSFFVKGECRRGSECPYRHEMPGEKESAPRTNILDRYHGTRDPVAGKMLTNMTKDKDSPSSSLFITKLSEGANEESIRAYFQTTDQTASSQVQADIRSVVMVKKSNCAFVNFKTVQSATKALELLKTYRTGVNAKYARPRPNKTIDNNQSEVASTEVETEKVSTWGTGETPAGPAHAESTELVGVVTS